MSLYSVHTGFWINWSHGLVRGATITLSPRDGALLLGFIAAFVTVVGGQLWKVVSFIWHQILTRKGQHDGLHFQQRNILRNVTSPGGAAYFFLLQGYHWRGRAAKSFLRTIPWALFATIYFIAFGFLAVFSSQVSKGAGSERLIRGDTCGFILPPSNLTNLSARTYALKSAENAQVANTYAHSCYDVAQAPPQCGYLPQTQLSFTNVTDVPCPFDRSLCNGTAFSLRTQNMDSHVDFGINAVPEERIQLRKEMTCAPIITTGFGAGVTGEDAANLGYEDNALIKYQYGSSSSTGIANATYLYNPEVRFTNIAYTLGHSFWYPSIVNTTWIPIPQMQVTEGDVDIVFIAFNSLSFYEKCDDIVFSAHRPANVTFAVGRNITLYSADRLVSPVACVTKHQFCNPNNQQCTSSVEKNRLTKELDTIGLSRAQVTTAFRFLLSLESTSFSTNIVNRQGSALRAQDLLDGNIQFSLPSNQWQVEAQGWFSVGLARLQFAIQDYAAVATASVTEGGNYLAQPWDQSKWPAWSAGDAAAAPYWESQCSNQRTNNSQGTYSFSLLGLVIIFVIGFAILVISLFLESIVSFIQNHMNIGQHKREAWISDSNLQVQRMLCDSLGLGVWRGHEDAVPTTSDKTVFSSHGLDGPQGSIRRTRNSRRTESPTSSIVGGDGITSTTEYTSPSSKKEDAEITVQSRPLLDKKMEA